MYTYFIKDGLNFTKIANFLHVCIPPVLWFHHCLCHACWTGLLRKRQYCIISAVTLWLSWLVFYLQVSSFQRMFWISFLHALTAQFGSSYFFSLFLCDMMGWCSEVRHDGKEFLKTNFFHRSHTIFLEVPVKNKWG